jgi:hypothetical protein
VGEEPPLVDVFVEVVPGAVDVGAGLPPLFGRYLMPDELHVLEPEGASVGMYWPSMTLPFR